MAWVVNATPKPIYTPEVGWAAGTVWTGAENLAPQRDSIHGLSTPCNIRQL
jgi:hypothetical protein